MPTDFTDQQPQVFDTDSPDTSDIQQSNDASAQTPQPTQSATQQVAPPPQSKQPDMSKVPGDEEGPSTTLGPGASNDPAVQHASRFYKVAEALAGGPKYTTSIDANTGQVTRTQIPLTRGDLGMAIAMEAISGAMAGLSQQGPGANKRALAAGFNQTMQMRQKQEQQQQQQVQQDLANQTQALARKASIYETNSRMLLNTSEAEAHGADAIDKLVGINRASGVLDVDPDSLDNGGQPMTQDELDSAMKSGALNVTDSLGPVAGRIEVANPDGSKRWESTHLVVRDPNQKVALTQDAWDRYAAGGVKGFPAGTKIGDTTMVPLRMIQSANEQLASHTLAQGRLSDLRDVLDGTAYADKVPDSIDFTHPGTDTALQHFQKYVSHNAANLEDPFVALQQMGADKRDPKTGEMQPNPDAKWIPAIADSFGGWAVLQAAHNEIVSSKAKAEKFSVVDSQDKAEAILAAPKRFSKDQVSAASNFIRIAQSQSIGKAVAEARARAVATGADVEAMLKTGVNPITKEKLSLGNAPDSMLVSSTGQVIPQNQVPLYKPTAQQKQTADTARQVLAISQGLQSQIAQNPALVGPLAGRNKQGLAKLGLGDAQAQKMIDDVSLLQSAVTKMHTGRFSNEILKKTGDLITPGMNVDQFNGAVSSIQDVANRYANEDKLITVGDYKTQQSATISRNTQSSGSPNSQPQIPTGATMKVPGSDGKLHWSDGKKDLGVAQ